MRILFLHNNYPAQFKHLLPALVKKGHSIYFLSVEAYGVHIKGVHHAVLKSTENSESEKQRNQLPNLLVWRRSLGRAVGRHAGTCHGARVWQPPTN